MKTLRGLRIVHPFPSFLVATVTALLALHASGWDEATKPALLGGGMLLYQFAIGIANDLVDVSDDRRSKPWKPLVSGAISARAAIVLLASVLALGLALTAVLGWRSWLVGVGGLAIGLAYDLRLKRTRWSWVPYSLAFPLLPMWVYFTVGRWDRVLWWAIPLGCALGFALHLANQAPDAAAGDAGIAGKLGQSNSRALATAVFGGVAVGTAAIRVSESTRAAAASLMIGVACCGIGPWASRLAGRDGLFVVLSLGAAGLALVLLTAA